MIWEQSALKRYAWTRLEVSQGTKFREQMLVLTVLINSFFWGLYIYLKLLLLSDYFCLNRTLTFFLLNILRFKGVNLSSKLYIVAFEMLVHVLSNWLFSTSENCFALNLVKVVYIVVQKSKTQILFVLSMTFVDNF